MTKAKKGMKKLIMRNNKKMIQVKLSNRESLLNLQRRNTI